MFNMKAQYKQFQNGYFSKLFFGAVVFYIVEMQYKMGPKGLWGIQRCP